MKPLHSKPEVNQTTINYFNHFGFPVQTDIGNPIVKTLKRFGFWQKDFGGIIDLARYRTALFESEQSFIKCLAKWNSEGAVGDTKMVFAPSTDWQDPHIVFPSSSSFDPFG